MAYALTIPDLVESEPMYSVSALPDGVTFGVTIPIDETAAHLARISSNGEHLPLVVLTTDAGIIALDSVYVTEATFSSHESVAHITFAAQAVRFV
jgi:hypothetical protein